MKAEPNKPHILFKLVPHVRTSCIVWVQFLIVCTVLDSMEIGFLDLIMYHLTIVALY